MIWLLFLVLLLPAPSVWAETAHQLNSRAVDLLNQNEPFQARELLQEALETLPGDPVIRANYASALLLAGLADLRNRKFEEASTLFLEGQKFADTDGRFWLYRAQALMELGETSQAEVELGSALARAPEDPAVYRLRGQLFYAVGRLEDAREALEKAHDLDPDNRPTSELLERIRREYQVERGMLSDYGGQFRISYDSAQPAEIGGQVREILEDAYAEIGSWFNRFPEIQVPVLVYTRHDFTAITGSPDWAGGAYDGKIRLPLGGLVGITPQLRGVLYHEYAHVLIRVMTSGQCPTWLNEGIAELAGRSQFDPPLTVLADAADSGGLFDFSDLETSLTNFTPDQARLAYEQSYSLVRYLSEYFGWYKLGDLLSAYGRGLSTEAAFQESFADFGIGFADIETRWRNSLGH